MDFYKVTCQPSIDAIRSAVECNGGILSSYGFGCAIPTGPDPSDDPEGWKIILCNTQGMGNHGSYVAVADSWENYDFQEACELRILRRLADDAEKIGDWREDGSLDIGTMLVPMLMSRFLPDRGGRSIGQDGKWVYYAHANANFVRIGDDRDRIWVRPQIHRKCRHNSLRGGLSDRQCGQQLLAN